MKYKFPCVKARGSQIRSGVPEAVGLQPTASPYMWSKICMYSTPAYVLELISHIDLTIDLPPTMNLLQIPYENPTNLLQNPYEKTIKML